MHGSVPDNETTRLLARLSSRGRNEVLVLIRLLGKTHLSGTSRSTALSQGPPEHPQGDETVIHCVAAFSD